MGDAERAKRQDLQLLLDAVREEHRHQLQLDAAPEERRDLLRHGQEEMQVRQRAGRVQRSSEAKMETLPIHIDFPSWPTENAKKDRETKDWVSAERWMRNDPCNHIVVQTWWWVSGTWFEHWQRVDTSRPMLMKRQSGIRSIHLLPEALEALSPEALEAHSRR